MHLLFFFHVLKLWTVVTPALPLMVCWAEISLHLVQRFDTPVWVEGSWKASHPGHVSSMGCGVHPCPFALVTILTFIEYTLFHICKRDEVLDEWCSWLRRCGAFHAFTAYRHVFWTLLHLLKWITGMDEWTDRVSLVHERVSVTAMDLNRLLAAHTHAWTLHTVYYSSSYFHFSFIYSLRTVGRVCLVMSFKVVRYQRQRLKKQFDD